MKERRLIASARKATSTGLLIPNLFLTLKSTMQAKMNVASAERGNIHKTKKIIMCQRKKTRVSRRVSTAKKQLKNSSSTVLPFSLPNGPVLNGPDSWVSVSCCMKVRFFCPLFARHLSIEQVVSAEYDHESFSRTL